MALSRLMGIPGNLQWRRIAAGEYETDYFCNGYKYRIYNMDHQDWRVSYMWAYDKQKKWKRTGGYHEGLKVAKEWCAQIHNMNPRKQYRFIGRATEENTPRYKINGCENWMVFARVKEVTDSKTGEKTEVASKFDLEYVEPTFFREVESYDFNDEGKLVIVNAS